MPQAARLPGRSPGHARRDLVSAGGTDAKATVGRPFGLVRRYQKNSENLMRLLHSQKGLDPQGNRQVEARFGILQIQAGDLADPVEAVSQGVRVDAQLLGGVLLFAGLEVGPERGDQGALAGAVVLDQRAEMAPAVVDEALVAHRRQQTGQAELRHGDDLAPALEASQRLHHRSHLAQRSLDPGRRLDGGAEPDGHSEPRLPLADRLLDLEPEGVAAGLVVAHLGAEWKQSDDLVRASLNQSALIAGADDGGHASQEVAFQCLDRVLRDLARPREAPKVVDVDQHDDVTALQRIADVAGAALGGGLVPIRPVQQVFEELATDPTLDLGQLALLGDRERQHERRLLDGHESQLFAVRRMVEDGDVAEHLIGREDRRDQALARHAQVGKRRHLDGSPPGLDLAQRALDLGVEQDSMGRALAEDRLLAVRVGAASGVSEEVEARVLYDDSALEQVGERAADLVHVLAVEHETGESAMDLDRALQAPVLGVDDPLEQGRHQVDELDLGGDGEERDLQPVGLG